MRANKTRSICLTVLLLFPFASVVSASEDAEAGIFKSLPKSLLLLASSYTGACGGSTDTGLSCKKNERPVCEGDKCQCVVSKDCGG